MKPTFPILAAVAVAAAGGWYAFSGTNAVNSTPINPLVSAANAQSADTAEADAPAATTEIQDMTDLGDGLHDRILNAVVNHLHEVPGPARPVPFKTW